MSTAERVRRALDGVRPHLGPRDGGAEVLDVEPSAGVHLRPTGAYDGCASSPVTTMDTIERATAAAAPETTGVEVATEGKPGPYLRIGARPPGSCPVPK